MQMTGNLGLLKPDGADIVNIDDINDNMDAIDKALAGVQKIYTVGGTGTVITITTDDGLFNLQNGRSITFVAGASNGGSATTLNIDGTGVKSLYKPNTANAPNLVAGKAYTVWYDSSDDCFFLKASAEGDAVAANVLAGKTFSNDDDTGLIGTMPDRGAVVITPGTNNQAVAAGYHNGSGYVAGDANLISGNIKSGISIFGVSGDSNVVNTSAGTATAAQILIGQKAYVDGSLVTGTMSNRGAVTITPGTSDRTITAGYHNGSGYVEGDANLVSGNIKSGASIFGVSGNGNVVDTSAGTAAASQILSGYKAYTDGTLLTGSMPNRGAAVITPGTSNQTIPAGYHNGSGYVAGDADLISANIKAGKSIFGVSGNPNVVDTSAGTAAASQILSGQKAYVNGSLVTGTMANKTGGYVTDSLTHSGNQLRMSIDSAGFFSDSSYLYYTDNEWIESNIKAGVNMFGKTGTLVDPQASVITHQDRLYITGQQNTAREANLDTLAVINTTTSLTERWPTGIGGIKGERLYYCGFDLDKMWEINANTFASINSGSTSYMWSSGMGGTSHNLFCCDYGDDTGQAINIDSLAVLSTSGDTIPSGNLWGIGGTSTQLYASNESTNVIYEVNQYTLHWSSSYLTSLSIIEGIGGTSDRLYAVSYDDGIAYELNPSNMPIAISTYDDITSTYGILRGIGGTKLSTTLEISGNLGVSAPDNIVYLNKDFRPN